MNKIDLPSANPEEVADQIIELIGCKREDILSVSAKSGMGVPELLEAIVERIPAPEGDESAPLQAVIFDSVYNSFRGIEAIFRIKNGQIRKGEKVKFMATCKTYEAD